MEIIDRARAVARMNELGAQRVPFIFVVDYQAKQAIVLPECEVDSAELRYSFRGVGNAMQQKKPVAKQVEWYPLPPTKSEYKKSFDIVQQAMAAGEVTVVNLTCKVPLQTNISLQELFTYSDALYRLWVKDEFVCFSPEMFVRIEHGEIASFPMKGTIDATLPNASEHLLNNPKEAAEHEQVVELIRQDLAQVASNIRIVRYRYIDRLETNKGPLLETSSEIRGTLPADFQEHLGDIIFSQLPAGSITGFPKSQAVEVIARAEGYDRRFYTGIMGRWDGSSLDTGVLIRFIDQEDGQLYFKAGGGITANSHCEAEYEEVIAKIYVPIC